MRRRTILVCIMLSAGLTVLASLDAPTPKKAKRIETVYNSYSWDNGRNRWVELEETKKTIDTFDAKGRILKRELFHGKGVLIERTVFTYSSRGTRKTVYNPKRTVARYADVLTRKGATTEIVHSPDGSVYAKFVTTKGDGGIPSETEHHNGDGSVLWKIRYEHDDSGRLSKSSYFNPDGSLAFKSTFGYDRPDARGNWTRRIEACTYADVNNRKKDIAYRTIVYRK